MRPDGPRAGLPSSIVIGFVAAVLILAAVVTSHGTPVSFGDTARSEHSVVGELRESLDGAGSVPTSAGLSLVGSIPVDSPPIGVVYDSRDANIDVLVASNNLTMVSASNDSVVQQIALLPAPWAWPVAETYDQSDGFVYVTQATEGACIGCGGPVTLAINGSTGRIVATNTSLTGIDVTDYLNCLGFDPQNGIVYACDYYPGRLVLYNGTTDTILRSINVGSLPSSVTFDPENEDVYVTNWGSDNVTVIDAVSSKVIGSIPVGSEPDGITFDSANGFLFVANNASDNVTVIDGELNTVEASVPVGCNPGALSYDSADGNVYVVNQCSDNLTAISGATNTVVGAVPVGFSPDAVTYDSLNERVYVANAGSNNVTVLATTMMYAVSFTEGGLPSESEWFVNLTGGASYSSATETIALNEPNGKYPYTVATTDKQYAAVGGSFTVNGAAVSESVTFRLVVFTVTLTETGLPSGMNWSLVVAGGTHSSSGTTIAIAEPNGSYAFTVGSVSGYSVNRSSGTVVVNGGPVSVSLAFTPTSTPSAPPSGGGSKFLGLPSAEGYAIGVGVVVVVVVAALAVLLGRRRRGKTPPVPSLPSSPPPPGGS